MSFFDLPLPGRIFVVVAAAAIAAGIVTQLPAVVADWNKSAAASARLDAIKKQIEPDARKMGMTPDDALAFGKAHNDAIKRFSR